MLRIFVILFLCGDALSVNTTFEEALSILTQGETATDYPKDSMDGDVSLVTEDKSATAIVRGILGRQNEVDEEEPEEIEINQESTTTHWSELQPCSSKSNEHYEKCGPRCQQSCAFQQRIAVRNSRAICESVFSGNCHSGCFCDSGYVRFNDECILPTECPTRVCLTNEEYRRRGTPCQITCDSFKYAKEIKDKCPKDIPIAGCFCKHGYVRGYTGACILPNRCSPGRVN